MRDAGGQGQVNTHLPCPLHPASLLVERMTEAGPALQVTSRAIGEGTMTLPD